MASTTSASKPFSWANVDWEALRRLRARFLQFDGRSGSQNSKGEIQNPSGDFAGYWSPAALASYDFTFAERIGWKWDTVLAKLRQRGWTPPLGPSLDWACGTGAASRRLLAAFPETIRTVHLWDRSHAARDFAATRLRALHPSVEIETNEPAAPPVLLLISHVLNELPSASLDHLLAIAGHAQSILWIEPGTYPVSRRLITIREKLRGDFRVIAPCTHACPCGLLTPENERHWCHHFALIPSSVHTDPGWSRFSATLQIDLSTLPFSYLVLDRREIAPLPENASRILGRPRHYKGYSKILSCQSEGVHDLTLQKRDAPILLKELKKSPASLYQWRRVGDRIRNGEPIL